MSNKNFTRLSPTCAKTVVVALITLWCTSVMNLIAAEGNFVNPCVKDVKQGKLDKQNKGTANPFKGYQRYQTFNEFKMRGEGKPLRKPFVYVKRTANRIDVVPSDDPTSPKHYVRTKENVWYQHLELEMYKINGPITKSGPGWPARTYDRVFCNDTILEYYCSYVGKYKGKGLYIKTRNNCVKLTLIPYIDFNDPANLISDMLKMKEMYVHDRNKLLQQRGHTNSDRRWVRYYELRITPSSYVYHNAERKEDLIFNRNSLGLWGIQPGIEKFDWMNSIVH